MKQIYVSTSGGAVSGTQATNALAGHGRWPKCRQRNSRQLPQTTTAQIASDAARNQAQQRARQYRPRRHLDRRCRSARLTRRWCRCPPSPISAPGNTPLAVNHQGLFVASTISFNLAPGVSLSEATAAIDDQMRAARRAGVDPRQISGHRRSLSASRSPTSRCLIVAALLAVYIVLGVLYESYVHPITILSTLPSAGVGAVLALMLSNTEFSIIALIGVILLIGIVKKNAIMMIDFALDAERSAGLSSREAIYQACLLRFRPIMMTTMAAMLGALPLAIGFGEGSELRRPLGISIVGGLIVSQLLTLYTTPVIYLYLDRFRLWATSLADPPPAVLPGASPNRRVTDLGCAEVIPRAARERK